MFARVILDINHEHIDQTFDYQIPDSLLNIVFVGSRVIVPFGHQNRLAFVYEILNKSDLATKAILDVIDLKPILDEEMFLMMDYLRQYNDKTHAKIIQTVLPNERMFRYENQYIIKNLDGLNDALKPFVKGEFLDIKDFNHHQKLLLRKAIEEENVILKKAYAQKGKSKLISIVKVASNYQAIKDKDIDLIDYIKSNNHHTKSMLVQAGYSLSKINRLLRDKVLYIQDERDYRFSDYELDLDIKKIENLNQEQIKAIELFSKTSKQISLLYGVTASGKTEVYAHLIRKCIQNNQQVLFLVPDISLIYQIYQRLRLEDQVNIVIFHSKMSQGFRHDAIEAIENGEANILIGTRSASFLKFKSLGLIIMDESHDDLYIQEDDVFYDTLEIIKIKANIYGSKILLGSATPSISSYYHAVENTYQLLKLTQKAVNEHQATLQVVDMKKELKSGNTTILSASLFEAITKRLKRKEQVLILFNQKGYAPFVMCRSCGYVPKDPETNLSLLYDKKMNILKSRQTKYEINYDIKCPICESKALMPVGIGIDYVYEYLTKTFKDSVVEKLDSSVLNKKNQYETLIHRFKNQEINILVGTKMISKGLDFKNVTLSAVLMADTLFEIPSYLASEQAYMTLTQMIGRSARHLNGDAIVQTYHVDHYVIESLSKPYEHFYNQAIVERKIRMFDPFYKVFQIAFYGNRYLHTFTEALKFLKQFETNYMTLGPSAVLYKKREYDFGFVVTIKSKSDEPIIFNEAFKTISSSVHVAVKSIHQIL